MKLVLKILKLAAILIIPIFAVLFLVSLVMQDKVAGIILKSLNNNFSTKIEAGSYHLSLVKRFPRATVELKNVLVYSSPEFNRKAFAGINTDTLLSAKSAFIDFKISDLIKGDYTFKSISVRSGNLNLFTDTAGHYNYDVSPAKDGKESTSQTSLNLNRVNLTDMKVIYNDLRADLIIQTFIRDSRIKSRITGSDIDFDSNSDLIIRRFSLGNFTINQHIPAKVDAGLTKNNKGIFFRKSTLSIETWDFILTGFIAKDNYLDLNVSGKNVDISGVTALLPAKYRHAASEYDPSGILKIESTIKGISSRVQNPHYEITWSLKDANIKNNKSNLKVDKFSFDGFYSNGKLNLPETSTIAITNFRTRLGSAGYTGSFTATDFKKPRIKMAFSGDLIAAELKEFLNLRNVESAHGSIKLNFRFEGYPGRKESYKFSDILNLESNSEVVFNSFGIRLKNRPVDLRDVNGRILLSGKNTVTDNLQLNLNDQRITLSGNLANLPGWLTGSPVILAGYADIKASSFKPGNFMEPVEKGSKGSGPAANKTPVMFPRDVTLTADFSIDTLIYRKFSAEKVQGSLSYKSRLLNFTGLSLNSQKGIITGSGFIAQNSDKSFVGKGNFRLNGIDVNETFTTFNNFGQNFLKAENLRGSLSGSLSVLIPVDSLLHPVVKSVTAEGNYILTNGELINFEPVKALSSFIEISELENIKFDQLKNDFFIRSNALYMPQMDVRSSAADLSVNGKHGFNNDYEYHVKLLLSEILSKKAGRKRSPSTEFGEVEDDGLGRTSLLLKVTGHGETVKVSYDMQAAGKQIRDDIKKERQTLKAILNEEYGGHKYGSEEGTRAKSRPRFRISWEGSDTINPEPEKTETKKESLFNKLFKKN